MSGTEKFTAVMGAPDPSAPPGLRFSSPGKEFIWEALHQAIGAGWFKDRFFYLFGEGLEELRPCLDAWPFLVPPGKERMILGRNAYGALFVLEDPNGVGPTSRVHILNPLEVVWWTNPMIDFGGLIGYWFPNKALPFSVLDDSVYQEWQRASGRYLGLDEILAIRTPLPLGGTMSLDNFQVENIVAYYRTTAPIYEKAFAQLRASPAPAPAPDPAPKHRNRRKH